jgi:AraC family transcriptional regulator
MSGTMHRRPVPPLGENCYFPKMKHSAAELLARDAVNQNTRFDSRVIADGNGWSIGEYTCRPGPRDRPFEERHGHMTIAAVIEGTFIYKADRGQSLMHPGSLLLGNFGKCFECGHDHSAGDRCISFHFDPQYFAEIAATTAGSSRYTFPTAMMPAARRLTPLVAAAAAMNLRSRPIEIDEIVVSIAETVLSGRP